MRRRLVLPAPAYGHGERRAEEDDERPQGGAHGQPPNGAMRRPQVGQSFRSFCESWSHQLQKRRFSSAQGSSEPLGASGRICPTTSSSSPVSRSRYTRPGSASMMTSRPVEGARMRYFCRSLTARHGSGGSGDSGADGHAAVGPGEEEVRGAGEPDDGKDERSRPDLVGGRAGRRERRPRPGDVGGASDARGQAMWGGGAAGSRTPATPRTRPRTRAARAGGGGGTTTWPK